MFKFRYCFHESCSYFKTFIYLFPCTILLCWIVVFYLKVLFSYGQWSYYLLLQLAWMTDTLLHRFSQACDLYDRCTVFLYEGEKNWWQPAGFTLFLISHTVNNLIYITTSNCICYDCDQCELSGFHHHVIPA